MIHSSRIAVIGAQTIDGAFGLRNGMPWEGHLEKDMAHFKRETTLAPKGYKNLVAVGKATFKTMGMKALPGRYMAVISSDFASGIRLIGKDTFGVPSVPILLSGIEKDVPNLHNIFLGGGESVWEEGFKFVSRAYITVVHHNVEDQEGLRRLRISLMTQATQSGLVRMPSLMEQDDWCGPVQIEFIRYLQYHD